MSSRTKNKPRFDREIGSVFGVEWGWAPNCSPTHPGKADKRETEMPETSKSDAGATKTSSEEFSRLAHAVEIARAEERIVRARADRLGAENGKLRKANEEQAQQIERMQHQIDCLEAKIRDLGEELERAKKERVPREPDHYVANVTVNGKENDFATELKRLFAKMFSPNSIGDKADDYELRVAIFKTFWSDIQTMAKKKK